MGADIDGRLLSRTRTATPLGVMSRLLAPEGSKWIQQRCKRTFVVVNPHRNYCASGQDRRIEGQDHANRAIAHTRPAICDVIVERDRRLMNLVGVSATSEVVPRNKEREAAHGW